MKNSIKKTPLFTLVCATIASLSDVNAASVLSKISITSPAKNAVVNASSQNAVTVSGACNANVQVGLDASDSAKKVIPAVTTMCGSNSKYSAKLNLSNLKDGSIEIRAFQKAMFSTKNIYVTVKKSAAVVTTPAPTNPAPVNPTPTAPVTTTTPSNDVDPFLLQVFSDDSPWNTPIGTNPQIEPKTAEMMQLVKSYVAAGGYSQVLGLSYKQWTAPLHFIDSTTAPKQTVYFDTVKTGTTEGFHDSVDPTGIGEVKNVPLPSWVWPDPKTDGHMIMYDTATGTIYEFSRFRWDGNKAYATRVAIIDSKSNGLGTAYSGSRWWMQNVRGSGLPFIGGLIRYSEFRAGEIKHAVSFGGPSNRLKALASSTSKQELCGPMATRSDGWETGENTILEGARIQLNPNLNLDSLGLSADAKIVARALQKYGGFMADNAATFSIYFENLGTADSYKWEQTGLGDLQKIPLEQFRVLKCNDIKVKN